MDATVKGWSPAPLAWRAATGIALLGLFLFLWRIGQPPRFDFDESHYVPAARLLAALSHPSNIEHPLLGKLLIGWSMRLFGDTPCGWRVLSALFGAITLFATTMAATWALRSERAGAMAGAFALLGHMVIVMARVAMLDIFLAGFLTLALWMVAAAIRAGTGNRARIIVAGLCFGLAAGCKWTAFPLLLATVLALAIARAVIAFRCGRGLKGWLCATDLGPVRGVSTIEAALWLGPFAAVVYLATFTPLLFYAEGAIPLRELIAYQFRILEVQRGAMAPHPYSSVPWQWVLDLRPIWFFYENIEGVQRGVLLLGNPVIMWAGLLAVPVALVDGARRRSWGLFAVACAYCFAVGMWLLIPKPVMFYYYYLVPSLLLGVVLAGVLDEYWLKRGEKGLPITLLAISMLVFWDFYPILTAAPLENAQAFQRWTWLSAWR